MFASVQACRVWLIARLTTILEVEPDDIDVRIPLSDYGLDSAKAIKLIAALSAEAGRPLAPTLLWEYPTIESLSGYLCGAPVSRAPARGRAAQAVNEPIAVIGLACRFPKAPDKEAFWTLLAEGRDAMVEIPPDRWPV